MKKVIIYLILILIALGMLWYAIIVWAFTVMTKRAGDSAIKYQDILITAVVLSIIGLLIFSLYKFFKQIFYLIKK